MILTPRTVSRSAIVAAATASAVAFPFLPERVATHFNAEDRPDGFSSRTGAAVLFPAMMLLLSWLNDRLGAWPGGRDRYDGDSGTRARDGAVALIELGLLSAHLAILGSAAGFPVNMRIVNRGVAGMLFLGLGNVLPTLPRNGLIGIRTPWTLADPAVWERTHRVGGYLVTAAGLVTLVSLPGQGKRVSQLPVIAILSAVGLSAAYSYAAYARRTHPGPR